MKKRQGYSLRAEFYALAVGVLQHRITPSGVIVELRNIAQRHKKPLGRVEKALSHFTSGTLTLGEALHDISCRKL